LIWFNNQNGDYSKGWEGYYDNSSAGDFSKGNGFGDVEPICTNSPSIEVGNLIWEDDNDNGVQDAGEAGLSGVMVSLYNATGTLMATTSTNATGNYRFSEDGDVGQNWVSGTKLDANSNYYIVFGDGQFAMDQLTVSGVEYNLAMVDQTTTSMNPDFVDSDAAIGMASDPMWVQDLPFVQITTNAAGANIHNFDVGFEPATILPIELININLEAEDCNLALNWDVASSASFGRFEVEVAGADGVFYVWEKRDAQPLKKFYSAVVNNEQNNVEYVRLKMIDTDGSFTYSEILNNTYNCGNAIDWNIYPNPTTQSEGLSIEVSNADKQMTLKFLNAVGQLVYIQELADRESKVILGTEQFVPGMYTVLLENKFGYRSIKKIVIAK